MKSLVVTGGTGCLLGALIVGNFLFGWLFLKPLSWLVIEFLLIMLFRVYAFISTKKIRKEFKRTRNGGVIDIEGKVVDEDTQ